jgi:glyoxylase-like metal-dependent hydrolase (beta-lactamase superfamily II)
MKIGFQALLILLVATPALAQSAAPVQTADPFKRGLTQTDFPRLKQIEPDVYTFEALRPSEPDGFKTTVDLIVVTPGGVLVADGQGTERDGRDLVASIARVTTQPIKYVVICSEHGDHTGGNAAFRAAFPDVVFISSPASQKALAKNANPPTETVADKRTITLGNTAIDILNLGRSHTGGDLAVHVPAAKVLFLSETYVHRLFPSMRSAYPSEWRATLQKAQSIDAKWYIAGHGFVDDAATMKTELEAYRQALTHVIGEANRLYDAKVPCLTATDCEAAKQADWGPYAAWGERSLQAPGAILRVYQERDGKLP